MFQKHVLMLILIKLCLVFCLFFSVLCFGSVRFKLIGLDSESECVVLQQLSKLNISGIGNVIINEDIKKRLDSTVKMGLRSLGYYSPIVNFFLIKIIILIQYRMC